MCEPTFFIIGAAKCGTSSLHFYLDQHPEISMSSIKEPSVFSTPRWAARWDDHEGLFDCEARVRGEGSTTYSRYPVEGDAAEAIHAAVPGAKLIYLVGEPVERAVSDYMQAKVMGLERRPFDEAVRELPFDDPENYYLCASKYTMQLERYLEAFRPLLAAGHRATPASRRESGGAGRRSLTSWGSMPASHRRCSNPRSAPARTIRATTGSSSG